MSWKKDCKHRLQLRRNKFIPKVKRKKEGIYFGNFLNWSIRLYTYIVWYLKLTGTVRITDRCSTFVLTQVLYLPKLMTPVVCIQNIYIKLLSCYHNIDNVFSSAWLCLNIMGYISIFIRYKQKESDSIFYTRNILYLHTHIIMMIKKTRIDFFTCRWS